MSEAAASVSIEGLAIQAVTGTFSDALRTLAITEEVQQIGILGLTALLVSLPETAEIPPERLANALLLLARGRSKGFGEKLAAFMHGIVAGARRVPAVAAEMRAAAAKKN
jgi:hypothetical protein